MPGFESPRLPLLELDPDLSVGLDGVRLREAHRLTAPVLGLRRGPWSPARSTSEAGPLPLGILILDGMLVREATVGEHPCAELLGPGDLLRGNSDLETEELLPRSLDWTVLAPARIAIVDAELIAGAVHYPEIVAALIDRGARRADHLVVLQAITHLTRVDDRLLALFWYLAERWGRVVPGGVTLSLRLPHRTLAGMVGARRPSVTTALGQLLARGSVERRDDGAWVLLGGPPQPRTATPSLVTPPTVPFARAAG